MTKFGTPFPPKNAIRDFFNYQILSLKRWLYLDNKQFISRNNTSTLQNFNKEFQGIFFFYSKGNENRE